MRTLTIALTLLATPALADVAGIASVIDGDILDIQGQRIASRAVSSHAQAAGRLHMGNPG